MPVLHTSRTSVRLSRGGTSACSSSLSTPCLERHTANPERVVLRIKVSYFLGFGSARWGGLRQDADGARGARWAGLL